MAIAERIEKYTVWVSQNDYMAHTRAITLSLESGTKAYLAFPPQRPATWLEFGQGYVNLYMTAADYDAVYHVLQTESPVFLTALSLFGLTVGAVHTELDERIGEPTGEGYKDDSLEALVVRARAEEARAAGA